MRTLKEWLEELPDGFRENAMRQIDEDNGDNIQDELKYAIFDLGYWDDTIEGHFFWYLVSEARYDDAIQRLKAEKLEVYNEYYKQHIEK